MSMKEVFEGGGENPNLKAGFTKLTVWDIDKIISKWPKGNLTDKLRMNPEKNFVIGYTDLQRFAKTEQQKLLNDRIAVIDEVFTDEDTARVIENANKKTITITGLSEVKEWKGKITEAMEIWKLQTGWNILPPASGMDRATEEEEIRQIMEEHNAIQEADWIKAKETLDDRVLETKESIRSQTDAPSAPPASVKRIEEIVDDTEAQEEPSHVTQNDQDLPWFIIVYVMPSTRRTQKYRGAGCILGPYKTREESREIVQALTHPFPHANVRATQAFHVGSLDSSNIPSAEEVIYSNDKLAEWMPNKNNTDAAKNFDTLLTDKQKIYHEMCRQRGVQPKLVESVGSISTFPDGSTIEEGPSS